MFKSQCGTDQISAATRSEPGGWGYTCAERLFPNIQARGLGLQFKYRLCGQNIRAVKGQWPKISVVNGQIAEKSRSKF